MSCLPPPPSAIRLQYMHVARSVRVYRMRVPPYSMPEASDDKGRSFRWNEFLKDEAP